MDERPLIEIIKEELADYEKTWELRHAADMRAIKRWREVDPVKRELILPDHADLCVFLLGRIENMEKDISLAIECIDEADMVNVLKRILDNYRVT